MVQTSVYVCFFVRSACLQWKDTHTHTNMQSREEFERRTRLADRGKSRNTSDVAWKVQHSMWMANRANTSDRLSQYTRRLSETPTEKPHYTWVRRSDDVPLSRIGNGFLVRDRDESEIDFARREDDARRDHHIAQRRVYHALRERHEAKIKRERDGVTPTGAVELAFRNRLTDPGLKRHLAAFVPSEYGAWESEGKFETIQGYVPELRGLRTGPSPRREFPLGYVPPSVWFELTGNVMFGYREREWGSSREKVYTYEFILETTDPESPIESWVTRNVFVVNMDHIRYNLLLVYLKSVGTDEDASDAAKIFHRYYSIYAEVHRERIRLMK